MDLSQLLNSCIEEALRLLEKEGLTLDGACERAWTKTLGSLVELRRLPDFEHDVLRAMRVWQREHPGQNLTRGHVVRQLEVTPREMLRHRGKLPSAITVYRTMVSLEGKGLIRRPEKGGRIWAAIFDVPQEAPVSRQSSQVAA